MGVQSIVNPNVTIYTSKKVEKEQHQLAIVGSLKPN